MNPLGVYGPYQGPRGQNTQGLLRKCLGIQFPPDQERTFWREEIRKVVTYSRTSCPDEPADQAEDARDDQQRESLPRCHFRSANLDPRARAIDVEGVGG